jgi:hypothetical protein
MRDSIYSDIEAQLIFFFQPELNRSLKTRDHSARPLELCVHNYSGTRSFDAVPIAAHREVDETEWSTSIFD